MQETGCWLMEGTVVGERYQLGAVLGIGGYGITYRGLDLRLERQVAVKEYYPGFWANRLGDHHKEVYCYAEAEESYEKGLERFLDEAKSLVALSHIPEVVRVSDFFRENNTAYLVMDYLDGQNLKQMAQGFGGRIPAEVLIPVLEPLIKSFGKIHASGLIHRDLSPDNIMMLSDGSVRLIDFGNARDVTNGKSMTLAMKQGFAAPEQYKSRGQGTWTDVYGICATMYYCLTGKLPPQAMERLTGAPFPTPTELGVDILPQWESAIMDGLDLFVKSRIQTMEELWERMYKEPDIADEELLSEQMTVVHTTDVTGNIQRDVTTIPTQQLTAKKYSSPERIQRFQERFLQMRARCIEVFKRMKEK